MAKILFILKRREDYNAIVHSNIGLSTGLYNSASFMNDMMNESGHESNLVVVADNNCIDREVTKYRPDYVIIEALWVVPQKFAILQKLHPKVKWIIRLHSEIPFMAGEGMAMDWIADYLTFNNVKIGINAPRMLRDCKVYLQTKYPGQIIDNRLIYLPNYYPQEYESVRPTNKSNVIDVGCFGAVRPLKNHLTQVIASIDFAQRLGKKLRFHVNAGRIEMKGEPMIANLKGVFQQLHERGHTLVNHQWRPREEFLEICSRMDIGMQCSFSETFNIVGADLVSQGIPLIGSSEIPWSSHAFNADPTDSKDIADKMIMAYNYPWVNVKLNQFFLTRYVDNTKKIWNKYFL